MTMASFWKKGDKSPFYQHFFGCQLNRNYILRLAYLKNERRGVLKF